MNDWEVESLGFLLQMLNSVVLDHNKVNSISWMRHSKGLYSVKSCYTMMESNKLQEGYMGLEDLVQ